MARDGNQIQNIMWFGEDSAIITLTDGTALELSEADIEMLQIGFESECEQCGFNPNEDPFEDSADEEDGEEDEGYPA